jgi:hypothetical protein
VAGLDSGMRPDSPSEDAGNRPGRPGASMPRREQASASRASELCISDHQPSNRAEVWGLISFPERNTVARFRFALAPLDFVKCIAAKECTRLS